MKSSDARRRRQQHRHHRRQPARVAVEQVAELAGERAERAAERRRRVHDGHHQPQPHRQRPPDRLDRRITAPTAASTISTHWMGKSLRWRVCCTTRVDQPPLLALVGDERVPLDDLGLLQHADELRQQQTDRRHGDEHTGR